MVSGQVYQRFGRKLSRTMTSRLNIMDKRCIPLTAFLRLISMMPLTACSAEPNFNGIYTAHIGVGPMAALVIIHFKGSRSALTIAQPFTKPLAPIPMLVEQNANRLVLTKSTDKSFQMVFLTIATMVISGALRNVKTVL